MSQPMELRGYSDRSTETLSVLVFMLEDLTAPVRCNLHSLHLQHLRGAERAYGGGGDLALQGAQGIVLYRVQSYGWQKDGPKDQAESPFPLYHLRFTQPLLGAAIKTQANPKCPLDKRLI